jgi:transporter family protein
MVFPKWLGYATLSLIAWGVWGFLVKLGAPSINPRAMQVLFVVGTIPLAVVAIVRTDFKVQRDRVGIFYGILNGVLATFGMLAFYVAMGRGKAAIIGPVTALFPLFTIVGARMFLKESLNKVQMVGIVVALAAMFIFAR